MGNSYNGEQRMLTRIWHALKSLSPGRYTCIVCNRRIHDFKPVPAFYFENAAKYGYKYSIDDAETLNYRQYSCPSCGVSDRDRLYALFISKYLSENNISGNFDLSSISSCVIQT